MLIGCKTLLPVVRDLPHTGEHLVSAAIVLLIALPTVRVATMIVWFLFHREADFALISIVVLAIIIASALSGAAAV